MKNGQILSIQEIKKILATADLDLEHVFVTNAEINGNFVEVSREELLAEVKDHQSWFYRETRWADSTPEGVGSTGGVNRCIVLDDQIEGQYIEIKVSGISDIEEELESRVRSQMMVAMDSSFKDFGAIEEFFLGADDQLENLIAQRELNEEFLDMEGLRDIQNDAIEEIREHFGLER